MRTTTIKPAFIVRSIMLVVTLMMITLSAHAASINWQSYSDNVFKKAKATHRMVLLYGYSPTCPYCKRMNSTTLTNSAVINMINQKYLPVRINTVDNAMIANQYNMDVIPIMIVLTPDGSTVNTIYGYQDAGDLLSKL